MDRSLVWNFHIMSWAATNVSDWLLQLALAPALYKHNIVIVVNKRRLLGLLQFSIFQIIFAYIFIQVRSCNKCCIHIGPISTDLRADMKTAV